MKFEQTASEPELQAVKETLRKSLEILLTEKKELGNVFRYMTIRPFRTILTGGSEARIRETGSAMQAVIDFCKEAEMDYPKKAEDVQALLEQLNSSELDEKIRSTFSQ